MVSAGDDRTISRRLTIAVFVTVLLLIVIVVAGQQIPHAKRPTVRQPTSTTTTITLPPSPP